MIDESSAVLPIWMLLSAAFGFLIGEACGNNARHRKCLEQANEDLRDQLRKTCTAQEPLDQAIKQQRGVINDIHRRLLAVSKGLEKRPS
jgi:hypothetical protein